MGKKKGEFNEEEGKKKRGGYVRAVTEEQLRWGWSLLSPSIEQRMGTEGLGYETGLNTIQKPFIARSKTRI